MKTTTSRRLAPPLIGGALAAGLCLATPAAQSTAPPPPPPQQQQTRPPQGAQPNEVIAVQFEARPPVYNPQTITQAALRGHLEFLASDALQGRASGSRDEWLAAQYIASQFRRWGLEPMGDDGGYVQAIEMASEEAAEPPVLTVAGQPFTHGKEMLVQVIGTPVAASGTLVKYQRGNTVQSGAIVLLPADAVPADFTAAAPASVILAMETAQVRASWDDLAKRTPSLPARAIKLGAPSTPRATRIALDAATHKTISEAADGAPVSFAATMRRSPASTFTWNAIGKLSGTSSSADDEVLVLSAHLDHIGARPAQPGVDTINNGADDDASGTVAVMALAEAMALGKRPRRTVIFALFGSEERGGFGAGYFVDLPVVPLSSIVADLQFEMIGRADPKVPSHHLWLTGYGLSNLGLELAKHGAKLVADPYPDQQFFTRSDNIRFARRGIVAHTVSSFNLHDDYHRPGDDVSKIDFAHMVDAIRSMLEPIRWLADSSFRPEWVAGACPAPCR